MSITYGLYNHTAKTWIDLGRNLSQRHKDSYFQADSDEILKFISDSINCKIEIIADCEIRPSDNDYGKNKYKKVENGSS